MLDEIAAYFLLLTAKRPSLRFGILLLFVILELGFVGTAFVFAESVLHELEWPTIVLGNLMAVAGMTVYLWVRHSNFEMTA